MTNTGIFKQESSDPVHPQDTPYLHLLDRVEFNPIFIMGCHRSGTTLLYKLLAETNCFNYVTPYHIIKYDELLSNWQNQTTDEAQKEVDKLFESLGLQSRGIDKVAVNSRLPEEYGFILGNADKPTHICPESLSNFRELCGKIQCVSDPNKNLLLKNPWDFTKFIYIKSELPKAKFIFLNRQPIHIINSQLKASQSLLKGMNSYALAISKNYNDLYKNPLNLFYLRLRNSWFFSKALDTQTREVARDLTYFIENINSLPDTEYICVKYEELCQEPEKIVLSILHFLGLDPSAPLSYDTLMESRPLSLLPGIASKYEQIHQKLRSYFEYFGYEA